MKVETEFVESIPGILRPNVIYVCIPCKVVSHLCPCGCGNEVVTPLTPFDWSVTYDGKHVSLWPSIGGWHLKCRSHYFIRKGEVAWAGKMTKRAIERGRRWRERAVLEQPEVPTEERPSRWWRFGRRLAGRLDRR